MAVLELLAQILVAAAVGGAIGLERELRGRAAGLRTHILVCVGAAVVMMLAGALDLADGPGRVLAGIVTGVGFLGAGAIIRTRDIVRGVTTAACIWLVAALGAAVGQGLYVLAVSGAVVAMVVLVALNRVERIIPGYSYHTVAIGGRGAEAQRLEEACRGLFSRFGHRVLALDVRIQREEDRSWLTFYVRSTGKVQAARLAEELLSLPGVCEVTWQ